jgi:hypothetical protein
VKLEPTKIFSICPFPSDTIRFLLWSLIKELNSANTNLEIVLGVIEPVLQELCVLLILWAF